MSMPRLVMEINLTRLRKILKITRFRNLQMKVLKTATIVGKKRLSDQSIDN